MLQICSKEGALTEIVKELPCHFVITIGALSPPHFLLHGVADFAADRCECQAGAQAALIAHSCPAVASPSAQVVLPPYDAEPMSPGKIGENEGAKFFCHTGFRMQRLLLFFSR